MLPLKRKLFHHESPWSCIAVGSQQRNTPPSLHISLGRLSTQGSSHRSTTNFSSEPITGTHHRL
ncbi:hypothetical protein SESBI_27474 [Sesbania bispinosa]|nr:hypothetical protein SESBI_27474 [Sesbania bispinosa]